MTTAVVAAPVCLLAVVAWLIRRAMALEGRAGSRPLAVGVPRVASLSERVRRPTVRGGGDLSDLLRLRAAIAGGGSVVQALDDVGAGRGTWAAPSRRAVAQVRAGLPLDEALDLWAADAGPVAPIARDALAVAAATGGSTIGALNAAVDVARARDGLRREVRMLSAPARASGVLVAVAPVGFAIVLALVDARVRVFLTTTWAGGACLVIGLALDAVGAAWMHQLVRRIA